MTELHTAKATADAKLQPEMSDVSTPATQGTFRETLGLLPNLLLVMSAITYGVGMVIENLHLQQYGLFHADLVRVEYLMVGLLWIVLVSFCAVMVASGRDHFNTAKEDFRQGDRTKAVLKGLLALFVLLGLMSQALTAVQSRPSFIHQDFWIALGVLLLNVLMFSNLSVFLRTCLKFSPFRTEPVLKYIGSNKIELCKALIGCLTALSSYALWVFPNLKSALGGGDRQQVEFLIKSDKMQIVRQIPFEVSKEGRLGPIPLLIQETDGFTVLQEHKKAGETRAVRISKDLVDAVIYHTSK